MFPSFLPTCVCVKQARLRPRDFVWRRKRKNNYVNEKKSVRFWLDLRSFRSFFFKTGQKRGHVPVFMLFKWRLFTVVSLLQFARCVLFSVNRNRKLNKWEEQNRVKRITDDQKQTTARRSAETSLRVGGGASATCCETFPRFYHHHHHLRREGHGSAGTTIKTGFIVSCRRETRRSIDCGKKGRRRWT